METRLLKSISLLETPSFRAIACGDMPASLRLLPSNLRAQAIGACLESLLPCIPHTGQVAIGPGFNHHFSPNRLAIERTSRPGMPTSAPISIERLPARNIPLICKQRGHWPGFQGRPVSCQPHKSHFDTLSLIEISSFTRYRYSCSGPATTAVHPPSKRAKSITRDNNLPAIVRRCKRTG